MHPNTTRRLADAAAKDRPFATYRGCAVYQHIFTETDRPWVWEGIQFSCLSGDSFASLQAAMDDIDRALGSERDVFIPDPMAPDHRLFFLAAAILAFIAIVVFAGWL